MVSDVLARLETVSLGTIQNTTDSMASSSIGNNLLVAIMIRPQENGGSYQLCFAFGEKRWRSRRSMHCILFKITFSRNENAMNEPDTLFEVSCLCESFYDCQKCIHKSAKIENPRNRIRVVDMAVHTVDSGYGMQKHRCWEGLKIEPETKDDVILWHVFQRDALSSTFSTSAMVLVDSKKSRLRKYINERVACCVCPGLASNRMICTHEAAAIAFINSSQPHINLMPSNDGEDENVVEGSEYWDTIVNEGCDENEREADTTVDKNAYFSTKPRNFSRASRNILL